MGVDKLEQVIQERDVLVRRVREMEEEEAGFEFDTSYSYDHTNAIELSSDILQDLEDLPSVVSPHRIFICIQRIHTQFKQNKFEHPEDFCILILVCLRSSWFTANQRNVFLSVMLKDAMMGCRELLKVEDNIELDEHKNRLQAAQLVIRDAEEQLQALNQRLSLKDKEQESLQRNLRAVQMQRDEAERRLGNILIQRDEIASEKLRDTRAQLKEITTQRYEITRKLQWMNILLLGTYAIAWLGAWLWIVCVILFLF